MPSFTAAQKTLIYELLELFQGTTFDWYEYRTWPGGTVTSVPWAAQIDFALATTRLEAIITAIEASADGSQPRLVTILSEYSDVSTDVAVVAGGGASGASGARYNPARKRERLRRILKWHLGIDVRRARTLGSDFPEAFAGEVIR